MRCKKTTVSTKGLLIASLLHHDIPTHFKSHTHMIDDCLNKQKEPINAPLLSV